MFKFFKNLGLEYRIMLAVSIALPAIFMWHRAVLVADLYFQPSLIDSGPPILPTETFETLVNDERVKISLLNELAKVSPGHLSK